MNSIEKNNIDKNNSNNSSKDVSCVSCYLAFYKKASSYFMDLSNTMDKVAARISTDYLIEAARKLQQMSFDVAKQYENVDQVIYQKQELLSLIKEISLVSKKCQIVKKEYNNSFYDYFFPLPKDLQLLCDKVENSGIVCFNKIQDNACNENLIQEGWFVGDLGVYCCIGEQVNIGAM